MWSIPVFNAIIVSLCSILFLILIKPEIKIVCGIATAYMALSVIWFYSLTSMMELPGYGLSMLWAGSLIYGHRENNFRADLIFFLVYTFSGFYRIIYFVFFFPVVLTIFLRNKKVIFKFLTILPFIAISVVIYRISQITTTAYPWGFMYQLGQTPGTIGKIKALLHHAISNLWLWFNPTREAMVLVISRYAYTILLAFILAVVICRFVKREKLTEQLFMEISTAIILVIAWILEIFFYDVIDWRDYRILYQIAWFAVIVLIMNGYQAAKKVYFGIQLATLALATLNFDAYFVPLDVNAYQNIMSNVVYKENASSRWENTIYSDIGANVALYLTPEQGIGITWGDIIGNEDYISSRKPGYIITMNDINIPGYTFKAGANGMKLYVKE